MADRSYITTIGARTMAVCDCGWKTVSTGPKARERVRKLLANHRCLPWEGKDA